MQFFMAITGLVLWVYAYLVGVKKKIGLLHWYHYQNVKEKDKTAYVRVIGVGIFLIGFAFIFTGILLWMDKGMSALILFLGTVAGCAVLVYGQYKYNGSIFS